MAMKSQQLLSITTVKQYLMYERQMHHWIQLTAKESKEMETKGLVTPNSGCKYKNKEGEDMVEQHVDSAKTWDEKLTKETRFGGYLSVQRVAQINDLPLVIFGHDTCIFMMHVISSCIT